MMPKKKVIKLAAYALHDGSSSLSQLMLTENRNWIKTVDDIVRTNGFWTEFNFSFNVQMLYSTSIILGDSSQH